MSAAHAVVDPNLTAYTGKPSLTDVLGHQGNGASEAHWFECAADLLAEPDPGETPFLVHELLVERSIGAIVGAPKQLKSWMLLDVALSVVSGTPALGSFAVPEPGPVLLIVEESGRKALHRRLDALVRGRGLDPEVCRQLHYSANKRVRLDDENWRTRLLKAATSRSWSLIAFDPLARLHTADENSQKELTPILHFFRELRDESDSTIPYVHHTGHTAGGRQRGTSDLEAFWESKILVTDGSDGRKIEAEHREAERAGPFKLTFIFDKDRRSACLLAGESELEQKVREYVAAHPSATANEVHKSVGGNRQTVLKLHKALAGGGS
jgi:hypothetical protein